MLKLKGTKKLNNLIDLEIPGHVFPCGMVPLVKTFEKVTPTLWTRSKNVTIQTQPISNVPHIMESLLWHPGFVFCHAPHAQCFENIEEILWVKINEEVPLLVKLLLVLPSDQSCQSWLSHPKESVLGCHKELAANVEKKLVPCPLLLLGKLLKGCLKSQESKETCLFEKCRYIAILLQMATSQVVENCSKVDWVSVKEVSSILLHPWAWEGRLRVKHLGKHGVGVAQKRLPGCAKLCPSHIQVDDAFQSLHLCCCSAVVGWRTDLIDHRWHLLDKQGYLGKNRKATWKISTNNSDPRNQIWN